MKLPELPQPDISYRKALDDCDEGFAYSPEAMRAYGRACAQAAFEEAEKLAEQYEYGPRDVHIAAIRERSKE